MNQAPSTDVDLPDDVVLSVRHVSKKFCRNLRRSMWYGMQDLGRNLLGIRPKAGDHRLQTIDHRLAEGETLRSEVPESNVYGLKSKVSLPDGAAVSPPDGSTVYSLQSTVSPSVSPPGPLRPHEFWALQDISFDLKRGESLGIIGINGSGKSTLFRVIAGIFPPDEGILMQRGRVGALIALGAGFHPHMTGRENVYLNGTVLGMTRREIDERFRDIVDFADIGEFLEAPLSTYSSGMVARLGFSIAINVNPNLLLVDEVLSVGDIHFQAKCFERMRNYFSNGGSVIFVSHNVDSVQSLCQKVVWVDKGVVMQHGDPTEVIAAYLTEMDRRKVCQELENLKTRDSLPGDLEITQVILRDRLGHETNEFRFGDDLTIEIHYLTKKRILKPNFWVGLRGQHGGLFGASMLFDGHSPNVLEGQGKLKCIFKRLPLVPQAYSIYGAVRGNDGATRLTEPRQLSAFRIVGRAQELGLEGNIAEALTRYSASILVPYEWRLPDGTVRRQDFPVLDWAERVADNAIMK